MRPYTMRKFFHNVWQSNKQTKKQSVSQVWRRRLSLSTLLENMHWSCRKTPRSILKKHAADTNAYALIATLTLSK
jgi:DICT domain-containing protein